MLARLQRHLVEVVETTSTGKQQTQKSKTVELNTNVGDGTYVALIVIFHRWPIMTDIVVELSSRKSSEGGKLMLGVISAF